MQAYEVEQYTFLPANVHVKYQLLKTIKVIKGQHVRLHIANLNFLTNIPTKYQPPTPYSLKDMGWIRF